MDEYTIGATRLEWCEGDITSVAADALVNAANSRLAGGGGVDGAIHRAGGPTIMAECRALGGCPTGSAVRTGAGRLPAQFVIHAVAPIYHGGARDAELLRSAYDASFALARGAGLASIALPSLGTGAYGYPIREAAPIALQAAIDHVHAGTSLRRIIFVLHAPADLAVYREALAALRDGPSTRGPL